MPQHANKIAKITPVTVGKSDINKTAGATPNEIVSASESKSPPIFDDDVARATFPSKKSKISATKIRISAISYLSYMMKKIAINPEIALSNVT